MKKIKEMVFLFPYTRCCTFSNRNAKKNVWRGKKKIYFIALKNSHFYNPNRAIKKTSKYNFFAVAFYGFHIISNIYKFFFGGLTFSEPIVEKNL